MRGQVKHEVTKEEFDKLVKEYPRPLELRGGVFTEPMEMRGGTWNRPVAAKIGDKFYVMRPA